MKLQLRPTACRGSELELQPTEHMEFNPFNPCSILIQ